MPDTQPHPKTEKKASRRRGARARLGAIAALASVVVVFAGEPVSATHLLEVVHVPPPVAVAGEPLRLEVTVGSSCPVPRDPLSSPVPVLFTCSDITVTLQTGDMAHDVTLQTTSPNAAVAVFSVPAEELDGEVFRYSITATQELCEFSLFSGFAWCHVAHARSPEDGEHEVPIVGLPTGEGPW